MFTDTEPSVCGIRWGVVCICAVLFPTLKLRNKHNYNHNKSKEIIKELMGPGTPSGERRSPSGERRCCSGDRCDDARGVSPGGVRGDFGEDEPPGARMAAPLGGA